MRATVDHSLFSHKLREYIRLSGKGISVALTDQARLAADRLAKLTFPTKPAEGKRRVEIDINRVFLKNEWFSETFKFRNKRLQEAVTEAVDRKDESALESVFARSPRLRKLHIQPFSEDTHQRARDNRGRVRTKEPFSFPLKDQTAKKRYIREKQRQVGNVKRGFARCAELLGGNVAASLRGGNGAVENHSTDATNPYITLINRVPYAASVVSRGNVIRRALSGRARDMENALKRQLAAARRQSGFTS